jgi:hypothetical protein
MDTLPLTTRSSNISSPQMTSNNSSKKLPSDGLVRSFVNGFAEKLSQPDCVEEALKKWEGGYTRTPTSGSVMNYPVSNSTAHSQALTSSSSIAPFQHHLISNHSNNYNIANNSGNQNNNNTSNGGGYGFNNQENNYSYGLRNHHHQSLIPSTTINLTSSSHHANTTTHSLSNPAASFAAATARSKTFNANEDNNNNLLSVPRSASRAMFSPSSTKDIKLSVQTPKITSFSPMARERPVTAAAQLGALEPRRFNQFFEEKTAGSVKYNVESFYLNSFVIELGESPLFLGCGVYFLKDIVQNLFNSTHRTKSENLLMDIISNLKLYKFQLTSVKQSLLVSLLEDIHEQVRSLWRRDDLLEFQRAEILCKKLLNELRRNQQLREALGNLIQEIAIDFLVNLSDKAKVMIVQSRAELQEIVLLMRNFESESQKQSRSSQRLFGTVNALLCCSLTLNIEYHRFEDSGYKTEVYTANNKIARSFDEVGLAKTIGNISFLKLQSDEKIYMLVQPSDFESIFKLEGSLGSAATNTTLPEAKNQADIRAGNTPVNTGSFNGVNMLNTPNNTHSPFTTTSAKLNSNAKNSTSKPPGKTPDQNDSSSSQAVMREINRIYKKTPVSNYKDIEDDPRPNSLKAEMEKKGMSRIKEVKQKLISEQSANHTDNKRVQARGREEVERSVERFRLRSQTREEERPTSKSFMNHFSQLSPIKVYFIFVIILKVMKKKIYIYILIDSRTAVRLG